MHSVNFEPLGRYYTDIEVSRMFDAKLLEPENSTPLYIQLANHLREQIHSGGIRSGDAIPSERDLSDLIGASRVTVRKAIDRLIAEGLLFRRQGSGTFVSTQIEAEGSFLTGFTEDAGARGDKPDTIWITKDLSVPSEEEALMLELTGDEQVIRLGRVRLANGEPLAIEYAVVPASILPDPSLISDSLYQVLNTSGHRPVTGTQKIRASFASATEAELLSVCQGAEILRIERLTRQADGRPVEFTRSAYRGDRYVFVNELHGRYGKL
jgi:GntR family transcriptional regulator